jgi:hypothetical protein
MKILLPLALTAALLAAQEPPLKPLPNRTRCRQTVSVKPWAKGLKQIPSTVIDKGVLRNVPYTSYRAGEYELNIYGDPEAPACFEIGVHGALLKSAEAKKNCFDIVGVILADAPSVAFLKALNPEGDKKARAGTTYEITPPTAEDAYGGWWISIYGEALLDKSRASAAEMAKITTTVKEVKTAETPKASGGLTVDPVTEGRWGAEDLADARKKKDAPEETQAVYRPAIARTDAGYAPTRTIHDTGWILFVCANSDKHEDQEVLLKRCPSCGKDDTYFWDRDKSCFFSFQCGKAFDNAQVKCTICGKVPKRVRTKPV